MKKKSDTLMNTKGKIMKFRISSRKIKNVSDLASGKLTSFLFIDLVKKKLLIFFDFLSIFYVLENRTVGQFVDEIC